MRKRLRRLGFFEILFVPTTSITKISIVLLYRRIFTDVYRSFVIATNAVMIATAALGVAAIFADVFECNPPHLIYTGPTPDKCVNVPLVLCTLTTINATLNLIILILPMPVIWKLGLGKPKKIALCAMFALGSA